MQTRARDLKNSRNVAFIYSPDPTTTTEKEQREKTAEMLTQPEHVFVYYKYEDLDGSGILALESEPSNAKFYTERPVLWRNALLHHHMSLYQQDIHCQMPRFRRSDDGDQLVVRGNYSNETDEYLVTVFVYTTGVVLIQGRDFVEWMETDLIQIRSMVDEDQQTIDRSLNESSSRLITTPPRKAYVISPPEPVVSTPASTDQESIPPDLNISIVDSNVSTADSVSLTSVSPVGTRQAELRDLEMFCEMVHQLSALEFEKDQCSRNDDTLGDVDHDCAECQASSLIIHELNTEVAKLQEQLQRTAASGILKTKLEDAEAAAKALLERNRFLESQLNLPSSESDLKDNNISKSTVSPSDELYISIYPDSKPKHRLQRNRFRFLLLGLRTLPVPIFR